MQSCRACRKDVSLAISQSLQFTVCHSPPLTNTVWPFSFTRVIFVLATIFISFHHCFGTKIRAGRQLSLSTPQSNDELNFYQTLQQYFNIVEGTCKSRQLQE